MDWIKAYVAVADRGGFLQAAQSLGRAQSRISEQVAKLEADLGVTLVDRAVRPVRLTVAGEVFLGRAKDLLATLDTARAEMVALRGSTYGRVRLACISSVAGGYLPKLINQFGRVEHNIEVEVLEGPTATLSAMVLRRDADLAIVPLAYVANEPELQWVPLWDEPLKLILPPTHRLAGTPAVSVAELANESVITPGSGDGARGLSPEVARLFDSASVQVGAARRVASPHTLVSMVRSGLGVGVLSELALQLTGSDGIAVADFVEPDVVRHTVVARSRSGKIGPAAERFLEFLRGHQPPPGASRTS